MMAAASARKILPSDLDVKLAFLRMAADVVIHLQRMSRTATDDTTAPPARTKDTPDIERLNPGKY